MSALPLAELLRGLPIDRGEADARPVTGIAHDSRQVREGDLFVAISGERFDGRRFAPEAAARGAVAILAAGPPPQGVGLPGVPWLETASPRALLGPLAARVYGQPDRELTLVGVTGTNGKSTVAILVAAMLEEAGIPAGLVGSLEYRFGGWSVPAARTTPEVSDLLALLRRMRDDGAEAAAMEVSSHALALGRVEQILYDVAVFTNLSRDHLDFHGDLESYFAAKRKLFDQLAAGGKAVVHAADPWGRRLLADFGERGVPALGFGEGGAVAARRLELSLAGLEMEIATPRGSLEVTSPLLGRYNAANVLAAVAAAEALELPHAAVAAALAKQRPVPGRLEPVDRGQDFPVFVDYSHTEAALEAALEAVRELSGRKVILVFGCGGDRDPGKRFPMGEIAGRLADLPIVTSDNPRGEDPLTIIREVERGLKASGNPRYRVMPDRAEAIRRAVSVAGPESVVLVAGKGDEAVQIIDGESRHFLDREEIEKALEERLGSQKLG
jgi:UDP-N-acetylmuramoyl-L-alanyl-D-glutamate--2,6-diaminopimelate ligase